MNRLTIGAGVVLLGLAGCDSGPPGNSGAESPAAPANASAPAPVPAPAPAAAPAIVLEGAGLRIPGASPPRTVAFETPRAETIAALTKALGRAPSELGENEECGGGGGMQFAEWKDDLTAWFLDGQFAGWDSEGRLRTIEGVGIGSGRAEVAGLPGFEVEESTLGIEFRAGGLSGILESQAADAKVTHLWGGATCVFR
ncbi:MAG TPA: hypothetical protein VEW26_08215 [Allosphingosinicella sp.]|nr:hypothetical protein [Allosphingosinicella sp.]